MTDEPFNPFASEDVSPPFAPHWEARRRLAQAIRNLTELVVTTDPAIEGYATWAGLAPFCGP